MFIFRVLFSTLYVYLICCLSFNHSLYLQILHTVGQIEIMRQWLMQLVPRNNENKHKLIVANTSKIIQKHQKIINFSKNIECLYSYIALIQFVSNTIMICSLGFLIVTVSNRTIAILLVIANNTININLILNVRLYLFIYMYFFFLPI